MNTVSLTPSAYIVKSVMKRDNLEPNIHTAMPILTTVSHALGNTERHPDTIESSASGISTLRHDTSGDSNDNDNVLDLNPGVSIVGTTMDGASTHMKHPSIGNRPQG